MCSTWPDQLRLVQNVVQDSSPKPTTPVSSTVQQLLAPAPSGSNPLAVWHVLIVLEGKLLRRAPMPTGATAIAQVMTRRDNLKLWWQNQLAVGIVGLIVALVARQWVLAGVAGFIMLYALLIMGIKSCKARGRNWS